MNYTKENQSEGHIGLYEIRQLQHNKQERIRENGNAMSKCEINEDTINNCIDIEVKTRSIKPSIRLSDIHVAVTYT
jgi:hypothetical protein